MITHDTIKVLTGPEWMIDILGSTIWNEKKTGYIQVMTDPMGVKYISKEVLDDPDYDFMDGTFLTDPNNQNDTRLIRDWLIETAYRYEESTL